MDWTARRASRKAAWRLIPMMSRFLLNIEKRSLSWLTLCGVGSASKNAM